MLKSEVILRMKFFNDQKLLNDFVTFKEANFSNKKID